MYQKEPGLPLHGRDLVLRICRKSVIRLLCVLWDCGWKLFYISELYKPSKSKAANEQSSHPHYSPVNISPLRCGTFKKDLRVLFCSRAFLCIVRKETEVHAWRKHHYLEHRMQVNIRGYRLYRWPLVSVDSHLVVSWVFLSSGNLSSQTRDCKLVGLCG